MSDETVSAVNTDRETTGRLLYKFAWGFEIIAVSLGLGIALVTLFAGYQAIEASKGPGNVRLSDQLNVVIAAVPFFMVAMVEATKIPLVVTFYTTTKRAWKYFFGICVALAAIITFETALNGLERAFFTLTATIDQPKKELVSVDERLEQLVNERTRLEEVTVETIEAQYNDRYNSELQKLISQTEPLQEQINTLRASVRTEVVESTERSLEAAREERTRLLNAREAELNAKAAEFETRGAELSAEIQGQRRSLQTQLRTESDKLSQMQRDADEAISAAFFTKAAVRNEWNERLSAQSAIVERIRAQLNSVSSGSSRLQATDEEQSARNRIRQEYAELIAEQDRIIQRYESEIRQSLGSKESDIATSVEALQSQIRGLESEFQTTVSSYQEARAASYEDYENRTERLTALAETEQDLISQRIELSDVINQEVGNNQIYRMAMWWSGEESAADVDKKLVRNVAAIWFGSLATLVALMGVVLALASLVLRDPKIQSRDQATSNRPSALTKLLQTMRRYKLDQRKALRQKTEIVEVDRVVKTEVPVEVVKKEYVHIPFYTNDESLLNISKPAKGSNEHE